MDYALTPHGEKLKPVLEAMCGWGQEHIQRHGLESPAARRSSDGPVYVWPDPASAASPADGTRSARRFVDRGRSNP